MADMAPSDSNVNVLAEHADAIRALGRQTIADSGRDAVEPTGGDEIVHLQRINLALESEVAELKAEVSHLRGENTAFRSEVAS
jgi:hypothetical protein